MSIRRFMLCSSVILVSFSGCGKSGPEPVVTREEYDSLKVGMTLQQVEAIIGTKGTYTGEMKDLSPKGAQGYEWTNPDNSILYCGFFDNKLETKVKNGFR